MSKSGVPSYQFWTEQANRWSKSVDFGSPMTAWTDAMMREYDEARRENRPPSMSNVK